MVCWALLTPGTAWADAAELRWAGPECTSAGPVFEAKLASLITPEERARLSGSVSVERRGEALGVLLSLELAGTPLGQRDIQVTSCAAAADTAAVAASLSVFSASEPPPAPEPTPVASTPPPVVAPAPSPAPPSPANEARPPTAAAPLELRAGLFASAERGALPHLAPGAALELGLGWGRLSLGLLGGLSLTQRHDVDTNGRVRLKLWSAAARGCYAAYAGHPFRTELCAGARLIQTRGQGEGFDVDREGSLLALAPLLGLDLALRAPRRLEWRLELEASTPLSRQRFVVRSREVARLDAVVLGARFGALVRF